MALAETSYRDEILPETRIALSGRELVLDVSGALWDPASRMLVVADLHLEKASSFGRRRTFLPPYDSAATLAALHNLILRRKPKTVICLGDSFHDGGGPERLAEIDRGKIAALQAGRDWIWIAGNHDPAPPPGLGGECLAELSINGLAFRHEPEDAMAQGEIAGHLHPCGKIARRGRSVRRRAFVTDGTRLILPSFGVLTGGLNVLDRAFAGLFARRGFIAFLVGADRLYPVAPASLRPD